MKSTPFRLPFFFVVSLAFLAACKPPADRQAVVLTNRDAARELETVKQETRETITVTKDYSYAQKSEFVAEIRAELAALNKELDQLSTKIESSEATARAEAKVKLEEVRAKIARLSEKLEAVQSSTESTWEEVKAGARKAYDEMKESFKQARQWLSEKIAP